MILYYFYQEITEIRKQGWSYFSHGWNYIDWINLTIALSAIILRVIALDALMSFTFNSTSVYYIDFPPLGAFATSEINIASINFFLIYFKVRPSVFEFPGWTESNRCFCRCLINHRTQLPPVEDTTDSMGSVVYFRV